MKKFLIPFLTASMLVSSTVVSHSVLNTSDYSVSAAESISIISQPCDFYAVNKAPVSIPVEAVGDDLSYQWWVSMPGSNRFYISSDKDNVYNTRMNADRDGRRVYCVITDKHGNSTRSETATIHLDTLSFSKQPNDMTGKNNSIVSTSVETNFEVLSYQWYVAYAGSDKFYKSSITDSVYKTRMTSDRHGRRVYCVVKDKYGNTAQSETVALRMEGGICKTHNFDEEQPVCKDNKGYKFEKSCIFCDETEYVYYDAIITFVDDDAKVDALNHWERIMDETGIKMTSAVIPSKVKDTTKYSGYSAYAGWDMIYHMKDKGMDFVHHTYNHKNLTTLTEAELHEDFKKSKEILSAHGIESDLLVYPNNAYNDTVLSVVPKYFSGAVTCKGKLNNSPLDNRYTIYRVNINDNSNAKNIIFGNTWVEEKETDKTKTVTCQGIRTVDNMKQYADNAVKNKAWLVFMSHAYYSPSGKYYFDESCEDIIIEFCNDVNDMGNVKFVTLTEGYELMN